MIEIDAIKCIQNEKIFYICSMSSKLLEKNSFITRREENPEIGFQRNLSESRAKDIAKYLDETKGVIPSSIILSSQDSKKMKYNKNTKKLSFEENRYNFLVLDGQHRMFGLSKAINDYEIPVIIFENLKLKEEVGLFIDINTTQKGVPQALLLDIKELADKQSTVEEKQKELFNMLNKDSVMMGLFATKSTRNKISNIAFNSVTKKIFEESIFKDKSVMYIYKALKNYLFAVDYYLQQTQIKGITLGKQVIFKAFLNVFEEIAEDTLKDKGDLKEESYLERLEGLKRVDFNLVGSDNKTLIKLVKDIKEGVSRVNLLDLLDSEEIF